jgi:tetratricopeptide (TPR) repeat protein
MLEMDRQASNNGTKISVGVSIWRAGHVHSTHLTASNPCIIVRRSGCDGRRCFVKPRIILPGVLLAFLHCDPIPASDGSQAEEAYRQGVQSMKAEQYRAAVSEFGQAVRLDPENGSFQCAHAFALKFVGAVGLARGAVRRCLKLNPDAPGAHYLAGDIEVAGGNYAIAIPFLEEAVKREPNNISVLGTLGGTLSAVGRSKEATVCLRRVIQLKPKFPEDYYNFGVAFLELSEPEHAESAFREAMRLAPRYDKAQVGLADSILLQAQTDDLTRFRDALAAYQKALTLSPPNADLQFKLGFVLGRLADTAEAITAYLEALNLHPKQSLVQMIHFNLGVLFFAMEDWKSCRTHLNYVVALDGNDFAAEYYLGSALRKIDDHNGAEEHLGKALKLNPDESRVYFQLAALHRSLGESKRASTELQRFRELTDREDAKAREDALERNAKAILQKGDTAQAIDALKQLYEARPDALSGRNLALALLQNGKEDEARRFLTEALALSPHDAVAHNYFGLLEARAGNLAIALLRFEKAVALDPAYEDALYNAGIAAAQLNQNEAAANHLLAAITVSDTPRARRALALVYAEMGRTNESELQFQAAQKLDAQNGERRFVRNN